jgi:hypothetical protein
VSGFFDESKEGHPFTPVTTLPLGYQSFAYALVEAMRLTDEITDESSVCALFVL